MPTEEENSANRKFFLSFIYLIPTYLLYFIILYTIFFSRVKFKFSGSFIQLFGYSALIYLFSSFAYYFEIRVVKTPLFLPFVKSWGIRNFLITILHTFIWYLADATHLFNLALSFNRFTVFLLRQNYQKFWNKNLRKVLAFCFLFPVLLVWHIPFTDIYVAQNNVFDSHSLRYVTEQNEDAISWMNNPRNTAILLSISSVLSLFMNLYVLVRLIIHKLCSKKEVTQIQGNITPQDIKLFIYTLLLFGTEVINCCQQVIIFNNSHLREVNPFSQMDFNPYHTRVSLQYSFVTATEDYYFILSILDIQCYLIDIITLAPAWFILFTHKILRRQIGIFFGLVKYEEPKIPTILFNSNPRNSAGRIVPITI
uniref:Serpentine receptor class gamma n=1 Tax=Panagrolaimus davidi TaxID=227884 RepID=A0A914QKM7_9BILA